jgi:hypothetical protein
MVRMVLDPSKTGIVGSNRTRGMDVCSRFSVLCSTTVQVEACDGPIPRPRSHNKMSKWIHSFKVNSESEQARGANP